MRRRLALLALTLGCTGVNPDPMRAQPKDKAYAMDPFFADARAMRQPVEGTVPVERGLAENALPEGGNFDAGFRAQNPLLLTQQLLAEGSDRFTIYCATCHGTLADGDTDVARKMAQRPPPALVGPLHTEDHAPLPPPHQSLPHPRGFYFAVISQGYGLMPSYASALTPRQRWAVVGYLEALAASQKARLEDAPSDVQRRLSTEAP